MAEVECAVPLAGQFVVPQSGSGSLTTLLNFMQTTLPLQ
jgi:hypothetical protein